MTSTDIVSRLGIFSGIAGPIMYYSKEIAIFIAVLSLLSLWVSGMLAKLSRKVDGAINAKEGMKNWLVELLLVLICFIILFNWAIPQIDSFITGTT